MKRVIALAGCAPLIGIQLFGAVGSAVASDPVGVFAVVERVVLEPNEVEPERIQIWGWFELANRTSRAYDEPRRGCLYYSISDENHDACRKEWNDIAESAASGKCIAFGQRYTELGKVRKFGDAMTSPLPYPLASGLFELRDDSDYRPVKALTEIPLVVSPADGGVTPNGTIEMKIKNIRGERRERAKYRFEIALRDGETMEKSELIMPGDGQTIWSPNTRLEAGKDYVWRVRAIDGDWKSTSVESRIKVEGTKSAS
jgi:hypothetical protein